MRFLITDDTEINLKRVFASAQVVNLVWKSNFSLPEDSRYLLTLFGINCSELLITIVTVTFTMLRYQ